MTSEITPKKPAKKIGKFETLALLKTTTSLKGKRWPFTLVLFNNAQNDFNLNCII